MPTNPATVAIAAAFRTALNVQDASNLSGVLHAWANLQVSVREDAQAQGIRYEEHSVNVLFLSKVTSLMRLNADCIGGVAKGEQDLFRVAYDEAKKRAT